MLFDCVVDWLDSASIHGCCKNIQKCFDFCCNYLILSKMAWQIKTNNHKSLASWLEINWVFRNKSTEMTIVFRNSDRCKSEWLKVSNNAECFWRSTPPQHRAQLPPMELDLYLLAFAYLCLHFVAFVFALTGTLILGCALILPRAWIKNYRQ